MAHPSGVLVPQAGRSAGTLEETAPPPGGSAGAAGPLPARRTMAHASGVLAPQARSVGGPPSGPARMTGAAPLAAGRGADRGRTEAPRVGDGAGPDLCILRLGNVVGADALSAAILGGQPVLLDRCAGGLGPVRSVIGPVTLGQVLLALAVRATSGAGLPPVLNVAQPGPVAMAALCAAAGRGFGWRAAGPATLPLAALETAALQALVPVPAADPAMLIGEWRAAGGLP